jgi:hypothetical protein
MSTKKLDEYRELYSEYIELSVKLHNYNQTLIKTKGYDTAKACKRTMKEMKYLLHFMEKLVDGVRKEHLGIWREEVASRKIIKPDGSVKFRRPPKKRKQKNGNNNRTTTKTV